MSDRYIDFINSSVGQMLAKNLGLPAPTPLDRFVAGQPVVSGAVLVGAARNGTLVDDIAKFLHNISADAYALFDSEVHAAAAGAGLTIQAYAPSAEDTQKFKAIVFDASGITESEQLQELHSFFNPIMRKLASCNRVIVLGRTPELCEDPLHATAQRALEGFTRALAKEVKKGGTAQTVYVAPNADHLAESTLRFFISPKSAYVSGQVARVSATGIEAPEVDWNKPLAGKVALVTGASRGIGEAIADVLARDGAHVICLDIPQQEEDLQRVAARIQGSVLAVDITAHEAPARIAEHCKNAHGGLDIIVHNAGVTRDKMLANMKDQLWNMVININLSAEERINEALLNGNVINANGRIICVSSISGIAGNAGQTNYATSKAGVIGMVQSMKQPLLSRGITINAVAPGFIETQMTAAIPFAIREAGRRMNSMSQGGQPVDVAETIAWYASPASNGLTGNVVRVCGQSLIGA